MKFEELKVGQIVKANEGSNHVYSITKETKGCVGKVVSLDNSDKTFRLEVTEHCFDSKIGESYGDLSPSYFDLVSEEGKMKINLKRKDAFEVEAGDFLVLDNGKVVLISRGLGGDGFRGVDLEGTRTSGVWTTIERTLRDVKTEFNSEIVRVISSKNIEVTEK